MERLTILFVLIFNYSFADSFDDIIKKQIDSLKSRGIEKVFVHQYSLFNGRYNIPYDNEELRCNDVPTVVHIFWFESEYWNCLRLDKCGLFEKVKLNKIDFEDITLNEKIKFRNESPHYTTYRLTKLYNDNRETVLISGAQLKKEKNETTRTFNKVNKLIRQFEDREFKRTK